MANDAITQDKIADDAVGADQLDDGSVTTAKIADDAVTQTKLAEFSVVTEKIANLQVTSGKLAANAAGEGKVPIDNTLQFDGSGNLGVEISTVIDLLDEDIRYYSDGHYARGCPSGVERRGIPGHVPVREAYSLGGVGF